MDNNIYFDDIKKKLNIKSDYKLASELGINQSQIINIRKNRRLPDLYTIFRISEILNLNPINLIVKIQAEKEKNEFKKEYWREKEAEIDAEIVHN